MAGGDGPWFGEPWKDPPSGQGGGGPSCPGTGAVPGHEGPLEGMLPCCGPGAPKSIGVEESVGPGLGGVGKSPTPGGGLGRGLMPCFFSSSTSFSSSAPASASSANICNNIKHHKLRRDAMGEQELAFFFFYQQ